MIKKIRVYGIVQGVGFRPAVDRHAHAAGVTGTVANKGPYVEIYAEGSAGQLDAFLDLIQDQPPQRAVILKVNAADVTDEMWSAAGKTGSDNKAVSSGSIPSDNRYFTDFKIIESDKVSGEIFISPDIAICDECKKELFDKKNRRYLHPFINCTQCGPRLTITEALPYDRERTSMKDFPMCPECSREYHDPASRRYDAQPVCCNNCGPEYFICSDRDIRGHDAISLARTTIHDGGIVAVKGIGGFHLCCDATSDEAVKRLRRLKHRPMKPFAVMMRDEHTAERECVISDEQMKVLTGHQKPVLLLDRRTGTGLSDFVAPDNPKVGVMLPYAPIQLLLFDYDDGIEMPDCLIMTSGNISGAPIVKDDKDALSELSGLCDLILTNNRNIRVRADDSVMDFYENEPYMIRRSRGYAPLPYILSEECHGNVLAIGGELKNTFCVAKDNMFYPSAYIGDMADVRTVDALYDSTKLMTGLLEVKPEKIVCDLHPKYNSTAAAERIAEETGASLIKVQHHYAHILSCMAENDYSGTCIGAAFDGTGYGDDQTIWGGEIFVCDSSHYTRVSSIVPFLQTGGDLSSREGWRIAVSMIYSLMKHRIKSISGSGQKSESMDRTSEIVRILGLTDENTLKAQYMLHDKRINSVMSTSCGRLFDAVSAVLGIRRTSTYEGEAAGALMYRAMLAEDRYKTEVTELKKSFLKYQNEYTLSEEKNLSAAEASDYIRTDILFDFIVKERIEFLTGLSPDTSSESNPEHRSVDEMKVQDEFLKEEYGAMDQNAVVLSAFFHEQLAEMTADKIHNIASEQVITDTAALSGGVFQNTLFLSLVENNLKNNGIKVLRHHLIPPNDGGIALGQALYALKGR